MSKIKQNVCLFVCFFYLLKIAMIKNNTTGFRYLLKITIIKQVQRMLSTEDRCAAFYWYQATFSGKGTVQNVWDKLTHFNFQIVSFFLSVWPNNWYRTHKVRFLNLLKRILAFFGKIMSIECTHNNPVKHYHHVLLIRFRHVQRFQIRLTIIGTV